MLTSMILRGLLNELVLKGDCDFVSFLEVLIGDVHFLQIDMYLRSGDGEIKGSL